MNIMFIIKEKKAQAAMEFLMTYGWAILIILVILGVLFFLGVFSPKQSNTCQATPPIICNDVKATDAVADSISFALSASGVDSALVGGVIFTSPSGMTSSTTTIPNSNPATGDTTSCTIPTGNSISTTSASTITLTNCGTTLTNGKRFVGTLNILYRIQGSSIDHKSRVDFSGTVE